MVSWYQYLGSLAIDFSSVNRGAYWWSATNYSIDRAWSRQASFTLSILDWGIGVASGEPPFIKYYGMSVRCIKDDISPTSQFR
jgi:hypothetical protein